MTCVTIAGGKLAVVFEITRLKHQQIYAFCECWIEAVISLQNTCLFGIRIDCWNTIAVVIVMKSNEIITQYL